jgi:hypothetical protein
VNPTALVATISGAVAVAVALWTAYWTSRMTKRLQEAKEAADASLAAFNATSTAKLKELEVAANKALEDHRYHLSAAAKLEDRKAEAEAVLERYRKPLLAAADDLAHRINNIRFGNFFERYLDRDERRRELALRATLFRFAKYFAWIELLDRRVTYLDFETESETQAVSSALRDIGGVFASDEEETRLMLWREEQRAIGGLMLQSDDEAAVLGFEKFQMLYDEIFSEWFGDFAHDLQVDGVEDSERLASLQQALAALVRLLDRGGLHSPTRSWWLQNTDEAGGRAVIR